MKIKRKTFWGGIVAALCACTALTFGAVYSSNNKVDATAATAQNPKEKIQLSYTASYFSSTTASSVAVGSMTPFDATHSLQYSSGPSLNAAGTHITYSQTTAYNSGKWVYFDFKVNIPVPAWEEWDVSYKLDFTLGGSNNSDGGYNQSVGALYYLPDTTTFDQTYNNTTQADSSSITGLTYTAVPVSGNGRYVNGRYVQGKSISHTPTLYSSATDPTTKSTLTLTNKSGNEKTFTFSYGMYVALSISSSRNSRVTACNTLLTADDVTVRELSVPVPSPDLSYNYDGTDKTSTIVDTIENSNWYTKGGADWYTPGSWAQYVLPAGEIKNVIKNDGVTGSYEITYSLLDIYPFKLEDGTFTTDSQTLKVTINPLTLPTPSGTVTITYNGEEKTLYDLAENLRPGWYDSDIYTVPSIIEMDDSVFDAGDKTVSVTLKSSNYVWSNNSSNSSAVRTFTFRVNKKALETEFVDENGLKVAKFKDENEIYTRDSGDKYPVLVTRYSKNGIAASATYTSPNSTGTWYAHAFLENAESCNYSVASTGEQFTLDKIGVPYPTLVGSGSEVYDGGEHEFIYEGYDPELMTYTKPDGAIDFDGEILKVKNAGTYTPVFTLLNNALYAFSGNAPAAVEVTPKTATLSANVDGGEWGWERRTTKEVEITVSGVISEDLPNLTINAAYLKDGVSRTIGTAAYDSGYKYKVTIPSIAQIAAYTLTLTIADGGNYALATPYTQTFNITGTVPPFDEQYIVWQYTVDGKKTQLNDFVYDGDVVLVEYTGTEYTFSLDETDLLPYGLKVKDDGYQGQSATNVKAADNGIYTMTVTIAAIDENTVFADTSFTLQFKITPKVLDLSNAEWEYSDSTDSDGNKIWEPLSASSKPSYTGNAVTVRISPAYMASLGLAAGDYTENYSSLDNLTEQGQKRTNVEITITNANYTTADGGYVSIQYDWEITARALTYSWSGTQSVQAGGQSFDIPAIVFDAPGDYSQYYEYIYTVDDTDYTYEQLQEYMAANWSDETPVSGTMRVQLKDGVTDYLILTSSRQFNTGTPKITLSVAVTGSGAEYGKVSFAVSVVRGTSDESRRTSVTVSGGALTEARTFDGNDNELIAFVNKLGAGSYTVTVSLKTSDEDSYVLSQREFEFVISKQNVQLPTVREIVFTGETINLIDYLDGFDPDLMKLIGAAEGENGIVSGRDYRKSGYFTTIALIDGANYQFVKAAESEAETVKATLKFAVAFADGEEVLGSEYEINWMINRFRITDDMWDKSGKQGVTLKLPAQFAAMAADENLLKISYSYYDDQNGAALEEFSFKGGNSFWVNATLTGEEANNFEFENGSQISDKTVYTVPQSKTEAFFNNTMTFVENNMILVIGCAAGLLLLILLIIIIACAARSRRKKREREEQRRLEEKEERRREQEERRMEREERMARMSQQQMMMPQMMPQGMPQAGGHMQMGGSVGGGSISEAQILQMQAELAELKAEKVAKEAAQQQIAQAKTDMQFAGFMAQLMGGGSMDKLTDIIRTEVRNALADEKAALAPAEHKAEEAKEQAPVCPPDAVMTTVTTTKIDTTKKVQNAERAAAPAVRTVVRNLVAPMPVDDGRVFDVGGFYTPADPVSDMDSDDKTE